jgi:1,2-diacylglycerol 3-alpha-glucosyltransferase
VLCFVNYGPYHRARLEMCIDNGLRVFGLELARMQSEYAWRAGSHDQVFSVVEGRLESVAANQWPRLVSAKLDQLNPKACAVAGYSHPGMLAIISWCLRKRRPIIMMSDSRSEDTPRWFWREWVKRRFLGLCSSGFVAGAPHVRYFDFLGMPPERVSVGYDVVDNRYFAENAEKLKTETLKPVTPHPGPLPIAPQRGEGVAFGKYFLASARFIEKKNLPRLIQAYARYRKLAQKSEVRSQKSEVSADLRPPASDLWPLVILGDGELRPAFCRLISDLRLQDCVHLPGFIQYPELPAYYAWAGAFIHASTTEQWGLVVNEAMASGLPVLVSNRCGCAPDLVQDGVNGFTFDPYNVEQLAQLMLKISAMLPFSPPRPGRGIQGEVSDSTSDPSDSIPLAREVQLLTSPGSMSEFQDVSLSAFGAASQRIISAWGPERFASGLRAAVEKAMEIGPKHAGILDRLILRALLAR